MVTGCTRELLQESNRSKPVRRVEGGEVLDHSDPPPDIITDKSQQAIDYFLVCLRDESVSNCFSVRRTRLVVSWFFSRGGNAVRLREQRDYQAPADLRQLLND